MLQSDNGSEKITFSSTRRSRGQADRYFLTGNVIFDRNIESTFSSMWE